MADAEVRKLVANKKWDELLNSDQVSQYLTLSSFHFMHTIPTKTKLNSVASHEQLHKELQNGHVFAGWKEGLVNFAPTYKYEFNSDRYNGEITREGEKKRSPAW